MEKKTWQNRKLMLAVACCVIFIMVPFILPMAASTEQPQPRKKHITTEQGDVYCRAEEHTYTYESGIQTGSTLNQVVEMWIGDQKIAHIRNGKKIVIDLEKNKLYFINHNAETYLETSVPVNIESIIPEEIRQWFCRNRKEFTQRVEEIDETKEIMGNNYE